MWRPGEAAFGAGALAVSALVLLPWLGFDLRLQPHKSALNDYWKARVPDVIYGRAYRPFVQRTLVPSTIRVIRQGLPRSTLGAIRRTVSGPPLFLPRKMGILGWEPAFLTEYAIAIAVLAGLVAGFPFALRRLSAALYDAPAAAAVAGLLATLLLPCFFFDRGTHYLYDFATLLLSTLALTFLAEGQLGRYYGVFVLGAFNKETMALMVLVFALVALERSQRRLVLAHVVAQVAIVGCVQWGLGRIFAGNPGGPLEWHLVKNMRLMMTIPGLPSLLLLAASVVLVFARLQDKPLLLRRALVVLPPLLVSYLCLGIYGEIRIFYEAYPVLFLLAFHNACATLGRPLTPREGRAIVATAS
ncbi:MAG: hypothetical protein ACHQNV_01550 [Vicinamibacteria bacterium]